MQKKISLKWLALALGMVVIVLFLIIVFSPTKTSVLSPNGTNNPATPMSYHGNIVKDTQDNEYYRRVIFTGLKSQLVVMSIPAGGEVGEETHKYTEQTLFFLSGTGEGILNDKQFPIGPGDVVVVVPGTKHNFINTGTQDLKLYTVYAPPNHIDGRVHKTKAAADADTADELVGKSKPLQ